MKPHWYQFTLGQLILLIILSAAFFAVLRTPFWPLVLAIGPVLPGFAIDRARGGEGLWGATLAGALEFSVFWVGLLVSRCLTGTFDPTRPRSPGALVVDGLHLSFVGAAWGMVVGIWAWIILFFVGRRIRWRPPKGASTADRTDRPARV